MSSDSVTRPVVVGIDGSTGSTHAVRWAARQAELRMREVAPFRPAHVPTPSTASRVTIAGAVWADWLFMAGLLGIGLAFAFGVGMRIAAAAGSLLLVMMWSVALPPASNPFLDEHLLEALVLILLAVTLAGDRFGFGRRWANTTVRRWPVLR